MIARKLMCAVAAVAVGLIGLGVGLAGDGPPAQPVPTSAGPAPVTPKPVTPAVVVVDREIDWQKDEARLRAILKAAHQNTAPSAPIVLIDAMCVHVPRGFCERSGLTTEAASSVWLLNSQLERRMFSALLRAEPAKEIVGRPQLNICVGKTGTVQVVQSAPIGTKVALQTRKTGDGKQPLTSTMVGELERALSIELGFKLGVTPTIGTDGQLQLGIEVENVELGPPVQLNHAPADGKAADKNTESVPSFNSHSLKATVTISDATTFVIRQDAATHEILWILTPHVIRGEKKAVAPEGSAPKPVPMAPVPPKEGSAPKPVPMVPVAPMAPIPPKPVSATPSSVDNGIVERTAETKDLRPVPVAPPMR